MHRTSILHFLNNITRLPSPLCKFTAAGSFEMPGGRIIDLSELTGRKSDESDSNPIIVCHVSEDEVPFRAEAEFGSGIHRG